MILFSSALGLVINKNKIMNDLIIDATTSKIFLTLIKNNKNIYTSKHENSKNNFDNLVILIEDLLHKNKMLIKNINRIYVNRGPGSFAGIRNSLSIVKAMHLANQTDYYCFSFNDFEGENVLKYENIPHLCDKFSIKKNLINPIYIS